MEHSVEIYNRESGISFALIQDSKQDEIIGFRLLGKLREPSGNFCQTFLPAVFAGRAYILSGEESLTFVNHDQQGEQSFSFALSGDELQKIKDLLADSFVVLVLDEDKEKTGFEIRKKNCSTN